MSGFKKNLFTPGKRDYILGVNRPVVSCILCSILEGDERVESLMVYQDDLVAISANLYPYNAGHLLLFPRRHIIDPRELSQEENDAMFAILKTSMKHLDMLYKPCGYNIGYNIGDASGASIEHLHQHIVPRYPKELGFVDITSGTKIIIEDPSKTMEKLRAAFEGGASD